MKLIPPPHVPIQILSKESWNMHRALALERLRLSSPSCIYSREIWSGERNILCFRSSMVMPFSSEAIHSLLSFSCLMASMRLHKASCLSFLLFLKVIKLLSAVCTSGRRGDIRYIIGNQTMRILRIVQIGDEFLFVIVIGI